MRLKGFIIDLVIGMLAIAAVLGLSMTAPLGIFNAKLTDAFLSVSSAPEFVPKTFIIKNTGNFDLTDNEVDNLVSQLADAGAAHVLVLDNASRSTTRAFDWPNNVHLTSSRGQDFQNEYPDSVRLFELNSSDGNYRSFSLTSRENSLLSLIKPASAAKEQEYERFFNFAIRPNLLPNITTQQALNGDIIQSLVADKIVFLQVSPNQRYERFYAAGTLDQEYLSYVEMQALAVETVVHDLNLKTIPLWVIALGLFCAYFAAFFLLQLFNSNGILLFETVQLVTALVLAYLLFVGFQLVFPFGELFLTQVMALLQFLISERRREGRILSSRTAKLQARLNQRMLPGSFLQAEDPWKNLHVFIDQHLHMRRSILLDRVEQDHRLLAIHSLNCTVDDIEERRRDFQRAPYSDAIQTQRPHRIGSKHYFKDTTEQEIEYIVPLMFAGEVLGFWALTVEPDDSWNEKSFEHNLVSFARELSELLYHRSKFVQSTARENRWLRKVINLNYAVNEHRQLDSAIELLERRLGLLQNVFSRNSSALVLYNLFGQVLTSNKKMDKVAQALDLKFFTMSAHDLLVELTGEKSEKVKKLLLQITLHHRTIEWPISSPKLESDYILRVLPIEREVNRSDEMSPFLLAGILFEFVDVHSVQQVIESKRELHRYYFDMLATDFAAIRKITDRLPHLDGEAQQDQIEAIHQVLDKTDKLSTTVERMLDLQQHSNEVFPVNPANMVQNSVRKYSRALQEKAIKIDLDWPEIPALAMVSVEQAKQLIDAILSLLIKDADSSQGELRVSINSCSLENKCRRVEIQFMNKGYGVPQERLESLHELSNIELFSEREDLFHILYLARQIQEWGAELKVTSELGEGFQLTLLLPTFEANIVDSERPIQ
ncbi:hypothetical protein J6J08_00940 [Pseudidiomarina sp. 1APR75-33.1]|uniref:hypothetical protein n=1 Tax=Pseudidiomarina terrestris TaxID=2820060 RepID=UPI00264B6995|nr:hypothetical protein [Pseudidiomarina sp. 1APR75-33.1]MDN7125948.1 hypothetical protein [Pseudidiomarina sp. 1APR75-33.1]